jgi:hypothetical protein
MASLRKFGTLFLSFLVLAMIPVGAPAQRYETLSGTIVRIPDKHHLIVAQQRTAGTWYVADTGKYRTGQRVTGTGTLDGNGVFVPHTIRVTGVSPTPQRPTSGALASCGGYRWPIKVAADPGAPQILPAPRTTSIADLVALPRPAAAAIRNSPVETTIWQVADVRLTLMYREHDTDYHLVLQDSAGHHLIAEAVNPACARTSTLLADIMRVRSLIDRRFGVVKNETRPNLTVSVRGVGFFDEYSGTAGQARNGIEVHPVTAICFGSNCAL